MKFYKLTMLALAALSLTACGNKKEEAKQPKYIIYLVSDGTGANVPLATEVMLAELEGELGRKPLCMTQSPVVGVASTHSSSSDVTDSAASGTALASGVKTYNSAIGVGPDSTTWAVSIAQRAHDKGYAVGIGTSCPVNHATPAAQFAHAKKRQQYYDIALQMAPTGFEFFGGGSINLEGHNKTEQTLDSIYNVLREAGYTLCFSVDDYECEGKQADKVVMLQGNDVPDTYSLPFWIDRQPGQVTIVDQFRAQLDVLYRNAQKRGTGFYLFNEVGGKVDFACHAHDGASAMQEVIAADSCFRVAVEFYKQHPDETLIVLTSDHDTGGMSLGNARGGYKTDFKILQHQKVSIDQANRNMMALAERNGGLTKLTWEQVRTQLSEDFGLFDEIIVKPADEQHLKEMFLHTKLGKAEDTRTLYASSKAFMTAALHLMQEYACIGWTTGGHTANLVPVYAVGVGAEKFAGHNDNADIPLKIAEIAGF